MTRGVEDRFLLLEIDDNHLVAYLAILAQPLDVGTRFRLVTVVHYRRKAGALYFGAIRPFHHLIVTGMLRAGALPPSRVND